MVVPQCSNSPFFGARIVYLVSQGSLYNVLILSIICLSTNIGVLLLLLLLLLFTSEVILLEKA